MLNKILTHFVFILLMMAFAFAANAQQDHFVYLQTENAQPFYVKLNKKLISSSATGYLILPKLTDGEYQLSVGFPKNEFPEESFLLSVNKNNAGYLVKNFGEKGWGLFNLQSYEVIMGAGPDSGKKVSQNLQNDPFSKMLATVVKDSTILEKNEIPVENPVPAKIDSPVVAAKVDSQKNVAQKTEVLQPNTPKADTLQMAALTPETVPVNSQDTTEAAVAPALPVPARKLMSEKNQDGMEMVYLDPSSNGFDTVRIFIPAEKVMVQPIDTASHTTAVTKETVAAPIQPDASATVMPDQADHSGRDSSLPAPPVFIEGISSIKTKDTLAEKNIVDNKAIRAEPPPPGQQTSVSTIGGAMKIKEMPGNSAQENPVKDTAVQLPMVIKSSKVNSDCKAFADDEDFLKLRKKMASENSDDNMIRVARKVFHTKCFSTEQIKNLSFLFLTDEGKYKFFDEAYAFASDSDQFFTLQSQLTDSYYLNRFRAMIHK